MRYESGATNSRLQRRAAPTKPGGDEVLYWMTASRRLRHNFSLDRALEQCTSLGKPLLVFEALRADYPLGK